MAERFEYDLYNVPVSKRDIEKVESMPYEFGWASIYETHVSFRTPSGYVYAVKDRNDL